MRKNNVGRSLIQKLCPRMENCGTREDLNCKHEVHILTSTFEISWKDNLYLRNTILLRSAIKVVSEVEFCTSCRKPLKNQNAYKYKNLGFHQYLWESVYQLYRNSIHVTVLELPSKHCSQQQTSRNSTLRSLWLNTLPKQTRGNY